MPTIPLRPTCGAKEEADGGPMRGPGFGRVETGSMRSLSGAGLLRAMGIAAPPLFSNGGFESGGQLTDVGRRRAPHRESKDGRNTWA